MKPDPQLALLPDPTGNQVLLVGDGELDAVLSELKRDHSHIACMEVVARCPGTWRLTAWAMPDRKIEAKL